MNVFSINQQLVLFSYRNHLPVGDKYENWKEWEIQEEETLSNMLASQLLLLLLALFVPGSNPPPKEVCSELPHRCIEIVANNSLMALLLMLLHLQGCVEAPLQPVRES